MCAILGCPCDLPPQSPSPPPQCLLVQGYPASTSWGFPKGKLEKGENDRDTAVREVRGYCVGCWSGSAHLVSSYNLPPVMQ